MTMANNYDIIYYRYYLAEDFMIYIGEKLNSSIKRAYDALENRNESAVLELAKIQLDGGADYLDVNTAMCGDEAETMIWACSLILKNFECGIMADSPDPNVIERLYSEVEIKNSIINSVTIEPERFTPVVSVVKKYNTGVVAMPIGGGAMPADAEERVSNSTALIEKLNAERIENGRIYVDIIVEAAGANYSAPEHALSATGRIREKYPDIHITAGLSNISFGLPKRGILNRAFLCLLMRKGLDSAILDTANEEMMLTAAAVEMLMGKDEFCMNYLTAYRRFE